MLAASDTDSLTRKKSVCTNAIPRGWGLRAVRDPRSSGPGVQLELMCLTRVVSFSSRRLMLYWLPFTGAAMEEPVETCIAEPSEVPEYVP